MSTPIVPMEVHHAWTIYGLDSDGNELPNLVPIYCRPQYWGHPRWIYHRYLFEWRTLDQPFRSFCHCWTDLKRELREYPLLFANVIVLIMVPGRPFQLCGRDYLAQDDIWFDEWGPKPPYYNELQGGNQ
jgi:hypothetical protein